MTRVLSVALLGAVTLFGSCTEAPQRLPYMGERDVIARADGGPADTVFATAPAFRVVNQAGEKITNKSFAGRAYITDFFFATCPGICPKMQGELLKVYQKYKTDQRLVFVSHTIDPDHDTLPVLREYAERLGIGSDQTNRWHFVTAPKDTVFALAHAYYTGAVPGKDASGNIAHNGTLALIDDQGHFRGLYDSLNPEQVKKLMEDIPLLLAEMAERQPAAKATAAIKPVAL